MLEQLRLSKSSQRLPSPPSPPFQKVKFQEMMDSVRRGFEGMPDRRKGQNARYEIRDAGMSAFSVFYLLSVPIPAPERGWVDAPCLPAQNGLEELGSLSPVA